MAAWVPTPRFPFFTRRRSPGPCTTRDRFSALAGAAMALSCSEVSAGPGEAQVLLVGPPPGVRSKGQGRALDEATRGPEAGPARA